VNTRRLISTAAILAGLIVSLTAAPATASDATDWAYLETGVQPPASVDSYDSEYGTFAVPCTTEYSPIHKMFPDHAKLRLRTFIKYYICTRQKPYATWSRPFAVVGGWNTTNGMNASCETFSTNYPWSSIHWFTEFTASNGTHFEFEFDMDCKTNQQSAQKEATIPVADRKNLFWGPNGVADLPHWYQTDTVRMIGALDDRVQTDGILGYFP
jgi:hypothetical protein